MNAKRDDNGYPTLVGVSSADGVTPIRAKADPVTGYILAEIKIVSFSATPKTQRSDDNAVRVLRGVTNDASQSVKAIISDPNNVGYVLADVLQI